MKKTIFTAIIIFICASAFSQVVNVGSAPNSGDGDNLRNSMIKINNKFYAVDDTLGIHLSRIQALRDSIRILRSAIAGAAVVTPTYASLVHQWTFEQNLLDQIGSLDGTASTNFSYATTEDGGNTYMANLNGVDKYVTLPYVDLTNTFAISFDYRSSGYTEGYRVLFTNDSIGDGITIYNNAVDGRIYVRTTFNGDTITARSDSVYTSYTIIHYLVNVNKSQGKVDIYAQGTEHTDIQYISTGFRTKGTARIGEDFSGNGYAYAYLDNLLIYTGELTSDDALTEYENSEYYYVAPVDTIAPFVTSAYVNDVDVGLITLSFNEIVNVDGMLSPLVTITQSDTAVTISSLSSDGAGNITFNTPDLTGGTVIVVNYTKPASGGIIDVAGNQAASFSDTITNNISLPSYSTFAFWPFDGNLNDSLGTYDGTAIGTPSYETTIVKSGAASIAIRDVGDGISLGTVDLGNEWTVVSWVYIPSPDPGTSVRPIIANTTGGATSDGYAIYISTYGLTDRKVLVQTGNGSSYLTAATGAGVIPYDTWTQVAVLVNRTTGTAQIRVNNVNQTVSNLIRQDFATSGTTYLGCRSTTNRLNGYMDVTQIYTQLLDSVDIDQLKTSPGEMLSGTPSVDTIPEPVGNKTILYQVDFDDDALGYYTYSDFHKDWDIYPAKDGYLWDNRRDSCQIVTVDGNRCMKATYPPDAVGSGSCGFQWTPGLPPGYDEIWFSYNLYFAPNFPWALGGKLPGLGGNPDNYTTGISNPLYTDGFQCGLMWGYGYGGQDDEGQPYFYLFHQDMPSLYGDSKRWGALGAYKMPTGQWINITVRFVMNTIKSGGGGNYDGIMEGFINGVLVGQYTNIRFRNYSNIDIDFMKIYSFFGGSGSQYAPGVYTYSLYYDFIVWKYDYGVDMPWGNTPSPAGRVISPPNYPRP